MCIHQTIAYTLRQRVWLHIRMTVIRSAQNVHVYEDIRPSLSSSSIQSISYGSQRYEVQHEIMFYARIFMKATQQ
jgi:hypothetical protein